MQIASEKYFIYSCVFHFIIFLILVMGLDFASPRLVVQNTDQHDVISAVVLGDAPNQPIQSKIVAAQPQPPLPPKVAASAIVPKSVVLPDEIALELKRQKKVAEKKLKMEQEKQRRDQMEKMLLADLNKEKQKKVKEKTVKKQFEKMLQAASEQSLRQQLLNEDIRLKGVKVRQSQGVVDKYKALILQAISEQWVVPLNADKRLYSELLIRLAPGGIVLDVEVSKSSGDTALDNSARAAIFKASPLPVPADREAFEPFRQFELKVRPENIL